MDSIKVLEEIGLQKVSKETHIELKYLRYMIDGDFDKLNRINTLGFIKILSREYNVDLSSWVSSFEEYWAQNRVNPEEDQKLFVVAPSQGGSKKVVVFLLILILVGAGVFYTFFSDDKVVSVYTPSINYSQSEVVKEAQEEINKIEESQASEQQQINPEELNSTATEELKTEPIKEEIKTESKPEAVNEVGEEKINQQALATEFPKTEKVSETFENQAVLTPKVELWIGVIYLDNFQRRSFLGTGNFSIDLSRDQIITTGHGSLSLKDEKQEFDFSRQSPVRFLVQNGEISEISFSKFKELNRGNAW